MEAAQLVGTVVFAISGVLAVAGKHLDWFGAIVVGVVTAIGGGTMRGLILGITPVFWIRDDLYLYAAIAGAALAIPLARWLATGGTRSFDKGIQLADAAGLALFAIVGADIALQQGFDATTAVVAAILSGAGGGVIRDLLAGHKPLIMGGEIYATAALAGASAFVALVELTSTPTAVAGVIGGLIVLGLRVAGIQYSWRLPSLMRD